MIKLVLHYPDGDSSEIASVPAEELTHERFADHLDHIAERLGWMAEGWRNRVAQAAEIDAVFAKVDLDADGG